MAQNTLIFRSSSSLFLLAALFASACGPTTAEPGGEDDVGTGGALAVGSGGSANTGGTDPGAAGGNSNAGGPNLGAGGGSSDSGGGVGAGGALGSAGGSPSGSGGDGGSPSGVLFMSDFESDETGKVMTGGAIWTTTLPTEYDSMGVVEVVEGEAHSGNRAIRVVKGNDGQAFLQLADASVFPFSGSVLFVRAFIKLATWPENHASWIEVGAATNEMSEIRLGAHQGVLQVNHWPGDQDQIAPDVTMSTDTWHCLEMSYDPGQKAVQVWLDDVEVPALSVMGSFERGGTFDPAPPLDAVRFGAEIAGTEAWFDDIAVGTEHIGCNN